MRESLPGKGSTRATEQQMQVLVTGAEAYSGYLKGRGMHWKAQVVCRIIKSAKEPGSLVWGIQGAWDELAGAFPSMNEHQPSLHPHHVSLLKMLRYLCIPIRMAEMKKTGHSKCWQAWGGIVLLHCWRECESAQPLYKTLLKNLKMHLSSDPIILLLNIYPRGMEACVSRLVCECV